MNSVGWSDHKDFILRGIRDMYTNTKYYDLEIKCHDKIFRVHKLILGLFTDYFQDCDGIWMRLDIELRNLELILDFIYKGEILVSTEEFEGFLTTCKFLGIKLFRNYNPNSANKATASEEEQIEEDYQERYELNNFQLLCKNCYKCFTNEKALKKHVWLCTRKREFECRFCHKFFRNKFDIENHERTHTGEKPFVCNLCNKAFSLKATMRSHIKRDHEKIRYPCEICDKTFTSRMAVLGHVKTNHTKVYPFACKECSKCYPTRNLLNTHLVKVHKLKKPENPYGYTWGPRKRKDEENPPVA